MKKQQREFILAYLREHLSADACDTEFHDEFYRRFGGKRRNVNYGARMVYKAMTCLREMHRDGLLSRAVIPLDYTDLPDGFPKWVYSYALKGTFRA